jgi:pyochelin biosynthesis protein PchC
VSSHPPLRAIASTSHATARLVCFPYAGGSFSAFRPWKFCAQPWLAVFGVEYPGHGYRIRDDFAPDIGALASEIVGALAEAEPLPTVLFGHSMGALVAFEVAHRSANTPAAPSMLVVSGCGDPNARPGRLIADLPDEAFIAEVKRFDGIPAGALEHEELRQLALPILRSDFRSYETYRRSRSEPLDCPILALGGDRDPSVPVDAIDAWGAETTAPFESVVMPGKHFFPFDDREAVMRTVAERVRARLVFA